jgi:CIC family chloride channel protein
VAYAVSNILGQPAVYAVVARHVERSATRDRIYDSIVADLSREPRQIISAGATLAEARDLGLGLRSRFVFVVGDDEHYLGALSLHEIVAASEGPDPDRSLASMQYTPVPVVYGNQKLFDVWKTVIESPAEHTPVLADPHSMKIIGVLRKSDLLNEARSLFS